MKIKNVIYNPPAVIVYWEDGSKTVSKVDKNDKYNKLTGFLLCLAKHEYGNKDLWKLLEKWVWDAPNSGAVIKKKLEEAKKHPIPILTHIQMIY